MKLATVIFDHFSECQIRRQFNLNHCLIWSGTTTMGPCVGSHRRWGATVQEPSAGCIQYKRRSTHRHFCLFKTPFFAAWVEFHQQLWLPKFDTFPGSDNHLGVCLPNHKLGLLFQNLGQFCSFSGCEKQTVRVFTSSKFLAVDWLYSLFLSINNKKWSLVNSQQFVDAQHGRRLGSRIFKGVTTLRMPSRWWGGWKQRHMAVAGVGVVDFT